MNIKVDLGDLDEVLAAAAKSDDPQLKARARFLATDVPRLVVEFINAETERPDTRATIDGVRAVLEVFMRIIGQIMGANLRRGLKRERVEAALYRAIADAVRMLMESALDTYDERSAKHVGGMKFPLPPGMEPEVMVERIEQALKEVAAAGGVSIKRIERDGSETELDDDE